MPTKIAVLHNPTAGDRDWSRRKLLGRLRDAGYRADYFSLKDDDWKDPDALERAELIVVAGGDGSLRKAVLELHGLNRPFAFVPLGTANNICTSLGIVGPRKEIVAGWADARRIKFDLGVARGPWGEKLFVESAGVGLVGRTVSILDALAEVVEHRVERREDRVHRDVSVVAALAHELQPVRAGLAVERERMKKADYLLLEIMNISHVGPNLKLAPQADPADGFFDVVSATDQDREKLKTVLVASMSGRRTTVKLRTRRARAVKLELSLAEFRLDDQMVLERPLGKGAARLDAVTVEISIRPQAYEVLVPRIP